MNNQVQNNEEKPVAVINEIQIKQFQSLYYLFKGKRDTDIKLFDDNKQFTYFEIIELNNKIYKKFNIFIVEDGFEPPSSDHEPDEITCYSTPLL